jgi:hypothetical protein
MLAPAARVPQIDVSGHDIVGATRHYDASTHQCRFDLTHSVRLRLCAAPREEVTYERSQWLWNLDSQIKHDAVVCRCRGMRGGADDDWHQIRGCSNDRRHVRAPV